MFIRIYGPSAAPAMLVRMSNYLQMVLLIYILANGSPYDLLKFIGWLNDLHNVCSSKINIHLLLKSEILQQNTLTLFLNTHHH